MRRAVILALMTTTTALDAQTPAGTSRPAPGAQTNSFPLRAGKQANGPVLTDPVGAVTSLTILQPAGNADTLRVSTGGDFRRCGWLPGTPPPTVVPGAGAATPSAPGAGRNGCVLLLPRGASITLRIAYDKDSPVPAAGNGWRLADAQWGGACGGTVGDGCILAMTQKRLVSIDTAAPGGVQQPVGEAGD